MAKEFVIITANDAVNQLSNTGYGEHCLIIYPDLLTIREFYSHYIKKMIEEKDGTVLVGSCYETTTKVRQILSENGSCLDVSKLEKEDVLTVMDSMEVYFGKEKMDDFIDEYIDYTKNIGKSGLSVVADVGVFIQKDKVEELVNIELTLPKKFNTAYNRFCIYHQKDFDRLTEEQRQRLTERHSKAIRLSCPLA